MGLFDLIFGSGSTGRKVGSLTPQTTELISREWEEIDILLKQRGPSQLRQALLKADKTFDNVLRDLFTGEGFAERLKSARESFDYQTYDKIWKAHKMRNSLVHETGYEPPYHMVEGGIADWRNALGKLGINV